MWSKRIVWLTAVAMVLSLFGTTAAFADDGKAALKFIPKETMVVASINMERLRESSLYKEVWALVESDPSAMEDFKKLKDATGFDIQTDLSTVVIALAEDFEESEQFLMIAKGKFDEAAFIKFAKDEGANITESDHGGQKFYDVEGDAGMAFVDDFLVVGPKPALKAAIDTWKGKMDSVEKGAVADMIKSVNTGRDLWFAMTLPDSLKKELGAELPMAQNVEKVWASLDLNTGLALDLVIGASDAETAKNLVALANEALKEAGKDPSVAQLGLDAAITKTTIAQDGNNMTVSMALSAADVEKIKQTLGAMMGGMMR